LRRSWWRRRQGDERGERLVARAAAIQVRLPRFVDALHGLAGGEEDHRVRQARRHALVDPARVFAGQRVGIVDARASCLV